MQKVTAKVELGWRSGFATPIAYQPTEAMDVLAVAEAQALVAWLLEQHGPEIQQAGGALADELANWRTNTTTFDTVWDPAFGRLRLAALDPAVDPVAVAVEVGIRLGMAREIQQWTAAMNPSVIRFGQRRRCVNRVRVEADATAVAMCRDVSGEFHEEALSSADGRSAISAHGAIALSNGDAFLSEGPEPDSFEGVAPAISLNEQSEKPFLEGLDSLLQHSARYAKWVNGILRNIVVCRGSESYRAISGSNENLPGVLHVQEALSRMEVAEILVHESAHQYFYLLQRASPVDDGSDLRLYWSPPIRKARPLSRVLMAYHALANVRLFYEEISLSSTDAPYVSEFSAELEKSICMLSAPLRGNTALTAVGMGLFEPLNAEMLRLGVVVD